MSRKECAQAAKRGRISVGGKVVTDSAVHINENTDTVTLDGAVVTYMKYIYIMLNKPQGYVSSSDEPGEHTVLELLPENIVKCDVFPSGRLDKDTTGLMIITNDGPSSHRALAPKSHVSKKYRYECADVLLPSDAEKMRAGITLADGYTTLPCELEMLGEKHGEIILHEGKYHQIKRMIASLGNAVTYLERISFADIPLDTSLKRGEWRYLTESESEALLSRLK